MNRRNAVQIVGKYGVITFGCLVYAAAVALFLDPNQLAPGGVVGISVILNRLLGLPTGTVMLCINIPLLIVGVWKLGLRFLISTIYATVVSSLLTNAFALVGPLTDDLLLGAVFGAILLASGMAFVFRAGATTGCSSCGTSMSRPASCFSAPTLWW